MILCRIGVLCGHGGAIVTPEECKKCKYHFKSQLDDIICVYGGGYDFRVIAHYKKGPPVVVMCPLEIPVPKRESLLAGTIAGIS